MKIAHVAANIEGEAKGTTHSVIRLCESLAALGHDVELHAVAASPVHESVKVVVHESLPVARRLGISGSMRRMLHDVASHCDVVHSHGLWIMPSLYAGWAREKASGKLVISPKGMLNPLARSHSRRRKQIMWYLGQRRALEVADLFHATSDQESDAIRAAGFRQPVAVVPNGVGIPPLGTQQKSPVVLYLGRLHRTKRVDRLIQAWMRLESEFPEWSLRIVGPAEDKHHVRQVTRMAEGLGRVSFHPPAYGADKIREYQQAAVVVLPTDTENFGLVVAEALAAGTSVIVTEGAPWSRLVDQGCGWWVERNVEGVATALKSAMSLSLDELTAMGARGRQWMSREFSWDAVARDMTHHYEAVLRERRV